MLRLLLGIALYLKKLEWKSSSMYHHPQSKKFCVSQVGLSCNQIHLLFKHVCSLVKVDVSGPFEKIEQTISQAEEESGPIFLLANCAGYAKAARFEDTSVQEIQVHCVTISNSSCVLTVHCTFRD